MGAAAADTVALPVWELGHACDCAVMGEGPRRRPMTMSASSQPCAASFHAALAVLWSCPDPMPHASGQKDRAMEGESATWKHSISEHREFPESVSLALLSMGLLTTPCTGRGSRRLRKLSNTDFAPHAAASVPRAGFLPLLIPLSVVSHRQGRATCLLLQINLELTYLPDLTRVLQNSSWQICIVKTLGMAV